MTIFRPVPYGTFAHLLAEAQGAYPRIREATTEAWVLPDDARYYLSSDWRSGFGITDHPHLKGLRGELIGVWSTVKGRGDALVSTAVRLGACKLDCFDGYLVELYGRHGFVEMHREPNWDPSGPDVVWMAIPARVWPPSPVGNSTDWAGR